MPISPFLPLHSLQSTSTAVISLPLKKKKKEEEALPPFHFICEETGAQRGYKISPR